MLLPGPRHCGRKGTGKPLEGPSSEKDPTGSGQAGGWPGVGSDMPRVWTRGQIRWVLPSYQFHKEAPSAEDTPVCFFEKKHHRCCMKASCQASPCDPYSGRLISKIKCIHGKPIHCTVQRHSGHQRGPRRFWNKFPIEPQLSDRASLKLWHCLGHDAHQITRDTELVPGYLSAHPRPWAIATGGEYPLWVQKA